MHVVTAERKPRRWVNYPLGIYKFKQCLQVFDC